ncbi:MAG: hypothetical protein ACLP1X_26285 [Polyangiaceae bacterium]|jgi:hypothetical protein
MQPTAWTLAFAAALCALGVTASCSSGGGGQPISCVAPGTACCAGNACAVGLECQNAVCVLLEADAASDDAPSDASAGDGG